MTSVGEILRSAREGQGRTAAELAEELCITQRYLRALEQDDLNCLPGIFFYKSFVRQYAGLLGIPEKVMNPALHAATNGLQDSSGEPTSRTGAPPVRQPEPLLQASNSRFSDHRIGMSVGTLVLVLAACSGVYAWWNRPPQIRRASPPVAKAASGQASLPVSTQVPTPATGVSVVSAVSDDPSRVVLNLSATEDTWIKITSNGKEIFSGILRPSQTKTLDAPEMAKMKVGNAGGLEVRMNGKEIGPLGGRGEVREILFTAPDNVQILEPTPPPPPDTPL